MRRISVKDEYHDKLKCQYHLLNFLLGVLKGALGCLDLIAVIVAKVVLVYERRLLWLHRRLQRLIPSKEQGSDEAVCYGCQRETHEKLARHLLEPVLLGLSQPARHSHSHALT